ncbi:MAG: CBS domain-containing protein [Nocardioides sp.]|uniref:CBS domain-containing protein n=1 Tax=Nocardioides sp. TaxID=35761 RepID=UPI0039E2AF06
MRIEEILHRKEQSGVVTIAPDEPVRALVALLDEHRIGACVVSNDGADVVGIVSERDVVRRLNGDGDVLGSTVASIMTATVATCTPEATVDELMATMTEHRIRHVPVLVEGRLTGIVSIGDLVKHRIDQLTFERDQLETYVQQS